MDDFTPPEISPELHAQAHALDPTDTPEDVYHGLVHLKTQYPEFDDNQILQKAQEMHAQSQPNINTQAITGAMQPQLNANTDTSVITTPQQSTYTPAQGIQDEYSPDMRALAQKKADLENNSAQRKIGDFLQVFAQGFGNKGNLTGALENVNNERQATNDKYLNTFDKNRQEAAQNLGLQQQAKVQGREDQAYDANNDKTSAVSIAKRLNAQKLDPTNKDKYKDMSGQQIDQVQPELEKNYKIDQDNLTRRDKIAADAAARAAAKSEKGDKATADKQFKGFTTISSQLSGTRSSDPAAKQAELDIYNANKVDDLINLYGDPNKLSPGQVALATSEIAKIAKGGVPDSQEWKAIDPATFKGALAKAWQKVTNEPSDANAGAFLKQYADYGEALRKNAEKTIVNSYGRKLEPWKHRLGEDDYNALHDEYIDRFIKHPSNNKDVATNTPNIPAGFKKGTDNGESGYIGPNGLFYTEEEMKKVK